MALSNEIGGIMAQIVEKIRDVVVERIQPEVIAKIDIPSVINLATLRAGTALGERVAEHATPVRK